MHSKRLKITQKSRSLASRSTLPKGRGRGDRRGVRAAPPPGVALRLRGRARYTLQTPPYLENSYRTLRTCRKNLCFNNMIRYEEKTCWLLVCNDVTVFLDFYRKVVSSTPACLSDPLLIYLVCRWWGFKVYQI